MYSAIYYPHINIRNQSLIKSALLLWDQVEYIDPLGNRRENSPDNSIQEALDLIAKPHIPTEEEKDLAHSEIMTLVNSGLPDWFLYDPNKDGREYDIYSIKFLSQTWEEIMEVGNFYENKNDYEEVNKVNKYLGLAMMSILADCCAGSQKRTITDEFRSYSLLNKYLTARNQGEYGSIEAIDGFENLVSISIKTIDHNQLEFQDLLRLRKDEITNKDTFLRDLRHNYLKAVDRYVQRISNEARHKNDVIEIERVFEQEISDDLTKFKKELKIEATKNILSSVVNVTALITAGAFAPQFEVAVGIGSIAATGVLTNGYIQKRNEIYRNHASAWLYRAAFPNAVLDGKIGRKLY